MSGSVTRSPVRVDDARDLAHRLLVDRPERWHHTVGVADRAVSLIGTIGDDDSELLVAAAWLHDVGYAHSLVDTGFHPLDGARYLDRAGWPERLVGLVAHHSGARYVAAVQGLAEALDGYPWEYSPLADALTYADQTIGPDGREMTVEERMREMVARHGPHSPNARAHPERRPYLLAAADRVRHRLVATP
jgi:putative nucleotidyltransferase with HDIG domain